MELCYVYCRDVSDNDSQFYSLPVIRMAKILNDTKFSLHVITIGEFHQDALREHDITVHRYDRWLPNLGFLSLYIQLFIATLHVGYAEKIDGFSNIWAHYNLLPVLLASKVLRAKVFARVFGMGNPWNRADAFDTVRGVKARKAVLILLKRFLNYYEAFLLNQTNAVYTNAKAVQEVLEDLGTESDQFSVISQGVDTEFFTPNYCSRERKVLFSGRVTSANKRFGDAFEVFEDIADRTEEVTFAVAGGREIPTEYRSKIKRSENIEWLGFLERESLRAQYRTASILLLTSIREGVPNVVLEAQSCGLPVVATNAGDVSRILDESGGGVAHEVGDIDGLAHSILDILDNKAWWRHMSDNGRKYVVENHSFESLRERYITLFSEA